MTAAFRGAPAGPAPLAPDVGVTGLEIGVLGFSSSFLADGVDALLEVPDLEEIKWFHLLFLNLNSDTHLTYTKITTKY